MKLVNLKPKFRQGEPVWGDTDDYAVAIGVTFDCPGCAGTPRSHRIWAPFQGRYNGPGPAWSASGSGYHDLTFSDSPQGTRSIRVLSGCKSHFNVTAGAIDFYGDSGHTQPQEIPMTDPTPSAAPTDEKAAQEAPKAAEEVYAPAPIPTAPESPLGYLKTHTLEFVNGILHQLHVNGHNEAEKVLVPVPGTSTPPGLLAGIEGAVKPLLEAFEARIAALEKALAAK